MSQKLISNTNTEIFFHWSPKQDSWMMFPVSLSVFFFFFTVSSIRYLLQILTIDWLLMSPNVEKFITPKLAFQEVRCLQMIHSRSEWLKESLSSHQHPPTHTHPAHPATHPHPTHTQTLRTYTHTHTSKQTHKTFYILPLEYPLNLHLHNSQWLRNSSWGGMTHS